MNPTDPQSIQPGFIVLQGNRLEGLRDLLVEWLARAPLAPLEDETVLVQSNGMAQWLRLALGRSRDDGGLGVATAMDLLLPARLQWQVYRAVMGRDAVPADAPLDKSRLTWRLLRIIRTQAHENSVFAPLTHYIDGDEHRAYQLAARLADQFDQYQVYRADWLASWGAGEPRLADALGRDEETVPPDAAWQPALWQAVLEDLVAHPPRTEDPETEDSPDAVGYAGRAVVHRAFLQQARALKERPPGLPRRIVVFGVSALPPQVLEVLGAVSQWVQVIFCLQNPCQHYWGDIVEDRDLFRKQYKRISERKVDAALDEHSLHQHAHPLLASWGKQGRDLVRLVDEFDQAPERARGQHALNIDLFDPPTDRHLLGRIQADLLDLTPMHEIVAEQRQLPNEDRSIAFTVAHSALREVEILQDQLLDAFDRDPSLQPRDIIVMVPDMTEYAPAISAVFGRIDRDDRRHLPYAISDRPEREVHPMMRALDWLLSLPDSRLAASEVLDLLEVAALRARFGVSAEDVTLLRHWIETAGIRWGLDAEHREQFGLPAGIEQNAWAFGLDRLLYAYLAGADDDWRGIVPVGGLDGMSAESLGPLHALLQSLKYWRGALMQTRSPEEWRECLTGLVEAFFAPEDIPSTEQSPTDSRSGAARNPLAERESAVSLRDRLDTALNGWLDDCASAAFDTPVTLETARSAWLDRLDEHRLSQRFLVGAVNFATLMPMRAIPFRQVYLLGMDDKAYPRRQPPADFDLMAGRYRPGDRSRREDDRYLFLEALLSARDRLWISWIGRDIRDNHERPASVLVNQLRDHIDRGWQSDDDAPVSESLTTEHPLQPFSRQYFSDERPDLHSYATEWHRVHHDQDPDAVVPGHGPARHAENAVATTPPVCAGTETVRPPSLSDLALVLKKPWRVWLGNHLAIPARRETAVPEDDEPFDLDPLDNYQLSARLLEQVLDRLNREPGQSGDTIDPEILEARLPAAIDAAFIRIAGAGQLPVHPFDAALRQQHGEALERQLRTWSAFQARHPDTLASFHPGERLGEGRELTGEIDDIRTGPEGAVRLRLIPGALHKGKDLKWHRLVDEWPYHLAAQLDGTPVTTYLISESDARSEELTERPIVMEPLDANEAGRLLGQLIEHWHCATTQPVPAEPRSQIAWVLNEDEHGRAKAAQRAFESAAQYEADLVRLWPDFQALSRAPSFHDTATEIYHPLTQVTRGRHREQPDKGERA
ncbi:exodeoxyribonuclease V subunit gamma [Guyparkeria sp. 1SP6A2]|nr:exodeoxyribonuclease V subunit gamma [Guyparkeria sp. 1SP6A2]